MVDLGGFAPPSRTLFSRLHTAITYIIHLYNAVVYLFLHIGKIILDFALSSDINSYTMQAAIPKSSGAEW